MNKTTILIASKNQGKVNEIREILDDFNVISYKDLNYVEEVVENAQTFEENALKKAKVGAKSFKYICIADDSGLCIQELNNWPGIKTARWMEGTDHQRNIAILEKIKTYPREKRRASFKTSIAIVYEDFGKVYTNTINGYISTTPRGDNGFGFDEIFELESGKTIAELTIKEKKIINPRKELLEKIKRDIIDIIS